MPKLCVMFRSSLYLKLSKQTLPNVLDDEVLIGNDGELIYSNGSLMFCIPAILNFPAPVQTIPEILARPYSWCLFFWLRHWSFQTCLIPVLYTLNCQENIPYHVHDSDRLASTSSKVYKGILKQKMNKNENENVMFILQYMK